MKSIHDQFVMHKIAKNLYMKQMSCINPVMTFKLEDNQEKSIHQKFGGMSYEF